jgi:EpsI family protein
VGPQDPLTSVPAAPDAKARALGAGARWRVMALQAVLFVGAALLFRPTTASLMHAWQDAELSAYSHGYLIVALSFALLLRNGAQMPGGEIGADLRACIPVAVLSVLWLIALRAGVQAVHQLLLPILMWLSMYAVLGWRAARGAAFAFGYLYLAIPIWGSTGNVLQWITVQAVDFMLQLSSVPAYVHGNIVQLAVGTFEIADGCSGMHFFIVALAIGALYGEVHRDTLATRLRVVALALGLAVLTNWVRVYLIILAGHLTDMQHYLVRVEHYRFGWVVFAIMMVLFFVLVRRMPVAEHAAPAALSGPAEAIRLRPISLALTLATLSIGPLWNTLAAATPAPIPAADRILPAAAGVWSGPRVLPQDILWSPRFAGADLEARGRYERGGSSVDAYVAIYASQVQGKEMAGYENSVLGPEAGQVLSRTRIEPRGPLTEILFEDVAGRQAVLWYFYRVGSLQTDRQAIAQAWYGVSSLMSIPLSRVVALRAACTSDCDSARANLQSLLHQIDFQ